DIVFRSKATVEQTLDSLQRIAAEDLKLEIKFTVENLDRIVYVAAGDFERQADDEFDKNNIMICGETRNSIQTRIGTLDQFVAAVSYRVGKRIVCDVTNKPKDAFSWSLCVDGKAAEFWKEIPPNDRFNGDADLVLENVSRQTGLTFKKTKRKVRIIN